MRAEAIRELEIKLYQLKVTFYVTESMGSKANKP